MPRLDLDDIWSDVTSRNHSVDLSNTSLPPNECSTSVGGGGGGGTFPPLEEEESETAAAEDGGQSFRNKTIVFFAIM